MIKSYLTSQLLDGRKITIDLTSGKITLPEPNPIDSEGLDDISKAIWESLSKIIQLDAKAMKQHTMNCILDCYPGDMLIQNDEVLSKLDSNLCNTLTWNVDQFKAELGLR